MAGLEVCLADRIAEPHCGIKNPAIAELEEPLKILLEKLSGPIEAEKYDLILGDDAGGRIPALILGRVINEVYALRGFRRIPIIFIEGTPMDYQAPLLQTEIDKRRKWLESMDQGGKLLFVTEYMATGSTVKNFMDYFDRRGIKSDVATIGVMHEESFYKRISVVGPSTEIFTGETGMTPSVQGMFELMGLEDRARVGKFASHRVISNPEIRKSVVEAREDARELARRLLADYLSQPRPQEVAA